VNSDIRRKTISLRIHLGAGAALALLLGCASHTVARFDPGRAEAPLRATSVAECFRFEDDMGAVVPFPLDDGEFRHYRLEALSFPSSGDNGQDGGLVEARYYRSKLPGRKPLVIVLPVWGGSGYAPRSVAGHLLRSSEGAWNVLRVLGPKPLLDWDVILQAADEVDYVRRWKLVVDRDRATVVDILRIFRWAQSQPELDGTRVGLVGFSHSALLAALAAAQEPRLAAAVLVMGGARPHAIMSRCHYSGIAAVRRMALERFGWSQEEYEARLREVFGCLDPALYEGRVDPSRVLYFDAGKDRCFPTEAREDLWLAFGRPERVTFPYGHEASFLSMTPLGLNWMRHRIEEFVEGAFARPTSPATLDAASSGTAAGGAG
jgi:dienelactone hydrolase